MLAEGHGAIWPLRERIGANENTPAAPDAPIGRGTALLVDDEDLVRMSTFDTR